MRIENARILLTGATGGIGQATAHLLAEKGAELFLLGRSADKMEELKKTLPYSRQHHYQLLDALQPNALEVLQQWLDTSLAGKKLDILINNAGTNQFQRFSNLDPQAIADEMHLNLTFPILLTQRCLAYLEQPSCILNIGSTFGSIGYPGYSTYSAAKAGLHRFSEALQRELDGTGIQVLYLAPRATQTDLNTPAVQAMLKRLAVRSDPPKWVAEKILQALEQEKRAQWLGFPEKLFVKINQLFPSLVSNSLKKQRAIIFETLDQP